MVLKLMKSVHQAVQMLVHQTALALLYKYPINAPKIVDQIVQIPALALMSVTANAQYNALNKTNAVITANVLNNVQQAVQATVVHNIPKPALTTVFQSVSLTANAQKSTLAVHLTAMKSVSLFHIYVRSMIVQKLANKSVLLQQEIVLMCVGLIVRNCALVQINVLMGVQMFVLQKESVKLNVIVLKSVQFVLILVHFSIWNIALIIVDLKGVQMFVLVQKISWNVSRFVRILVLMCILRQKLRGRNLIRCFLIIQEYLLVFLFQLFY